MRSVAVSMTVMVPSRSLVTKASGPEGFEVQLASVRAPKTRSIFVLLMSGTAPFLMATTPQHRTTTANAADRKDPTDPSEPGNPPYASLQTRATTRARCATPPNVPAPHNSPRETPTRNNVLY